MFDIDDCFEEGIADAVALQDGAKKLKCLDSDKALEGYVLDCPPGYNQGVRIRGDFQATRCEFAEQNQRICLPHLPGRDPAIWCTAPHMFNGITNIKSRVNYLIPRSSSLSQRLPFRPLPSPSKLLRKLREVAGLHLVRHGGNHDIYETANGKRIPIPRHPGDFGKGLICKILAEAEVNMSLHEFLQA